MVETRLHNTFPQPAVDYDIHERKWITRLAFILVLASLIHSFFAHTLLHQLASPVLRFPYIDLSYWALLYMRLPQLMTGSFAWIFDLVLVASCLLSIFRPLQRWWPAIFVAFYFLYFITFNLFGGHHTNHKIGILLIGIPFIARNIVSFNLLWQGLRYFLLWSYSSAFLWKFFRFSWLHENQGVLIMQKNLQQSWLLSYPGLVNGMYIAGFVLEGLFIIGFFTRKWDKILFTVSLLMVIGFWVMANAHFFEMLILNLTLLNLKGVTKPRVKVVRS